MKNTIRLQVIILFFISSNLLCQPHLEWAKGIGGEDTDNGYSVTTDSEGNTYLTGYFRETIDFDIGDGVCELSSNGKSDIFILKLDSYGSFEWAKSIGGCESDVGSSIYIDESGYIYITGFFEDTVDFNLDDKAHQLISAGKWDIFILKLDMDGSFLWAETIGGNYNDEGNDISVDLYGNIFVAGVFQDTVDFDPGNGVYNLVSRCSFDCFILKLDSDGNFVWAKDFGNTDADYCNSTINDRYGNVYIAGIFEDRVDFDPGPELYNITSNDGDIYILKLDSNGNFIWVKTIGGFDYDVCFSLTSDTHGNIYSTGYFKDSVDFDPGNGVSNMYSNGYGDIFVLKLDSDGNYIWAKTIGGTYPDVGYSISTDAKGNNYTTGKFEGSMDFDSGIGVNNLTSNGSTDVFILKLDSDGNFVWAKTVGGEDADNSWSLYADAKENVYVTGYFKTYVDFDLWNSEFSLSTNGGYDAFLLRISQSLQVFFATSGTLFNLGDTVEFTDLSTYSPTSWLWDFGDNNTSVEKNPSHVYQNCGKYDVSLIVSKGTDKDTMLVEECIIIKDFQTNVSERPYSIIQIDQNIPNPFFKNTQIGFYMSKQSFIKLELFNILGDRIETIVAQNYPEGKHSIIFDRKNLPSGIYLYRFSTNGFSESKLMNIE